MARSFRWTTALIPAFLCLASGGFAQSAPPDSAPPATPGSQPTTPSGTQPAPAEPQEDKRIFGVLPNNRTTEGSTPFAPISAKRKLTIAYKDSFDWPVYPTAAAFAALYHLENQNPSFGQGMAGYAKRFGGAYGDQMIGNMMTEGFVPILTHEDPRFFRTGQGTKKHRLKGALMQILVTRTDSGGKTFNLSEWGGNAISVAVSNAWYPDTRTASDNAQKWLVAIGTDTFSNVLKEFWPDVKRFLTKKHDTPAATPAASK
jgi:hypothetical protein